MVIFVVMVIVVIIVVVVVAAQFLFSSFFDILIPHCVVSLGNVKYTMHAFWYFMQKMGIEHSAYILEAKVSFEILLVANSQKPPNRNTQCCFWLFFFDKHTHIWSNKLKLDQVLSVESQPIFPLSLSLSFFLSLFLSLSLSFFLFLSSDDVCCH